MPDTEYLTVREYFVVSLVDTVITGVSYPGSNSLSILNTHSLSIGIVLCSKPLSENDIYRFPPFTSTKWAIVLSFWCSDDSTSLANLFGIAVMLVLADRPKKWVVNSLFRSVHMMFSTELLGFVNSIL